MARTMLSYLTGAAGQLYRACTALLDRSECGEDISAKEIRDLTVTLKELSALRESLGDKQTPTVKVIFDGEAEEWSK